VRGDKSTITTLLRQSSIRILETAREEIIQATLVIEEMVRVDPQVLGNELYYCHTESGPTRR
jgi:hypothetical protein